jgi:hypothetical protein
MFVPIAVVALRKGQAVQKKNWKKIHRKTDPYLKPVDMEKFEPLLSKNKRIKASPAKLNDNLPLRRTGNGEFRGEMLY